MAYNDQPFLHGIEQIDEYGDAVDPEDYAQEVTDLVSTLRAEYLAVRAAITELATGKRVSRLTINGKAIEYSAADLPALRALRDELAEELRTLTGRAATYRPIKVMTSKGL